MLMPFALATTKKLQQILSKLAWQALALRRFAEPVSIKRPPLEKRLLNLGRFFSLAIKTTIILQGVLQLCSQAITLLDLLRCASNSLIY